MSAPEKKLESLTPNAEDLKNPPPILDCKIKKENPLPPIGDEQTTMGRYRQELQLAKGFYERIPFVLPMAQERLHAKRVQFEQAQSEVFLLEQSLAKVEQSMRRINELINGDPKGVTDAVLDEARRTIEQDVRLGPKLDDKRQELKRLNEEIRALNSKVTQMKRFYEQGEQFERAFKQRVAKFSQKMVQLMDYVNPRSTSQH